MFVVYVIIYKYNLYYYCLNSVKNVKSLLQMIYLLPIIVYLIMIIFVIKGVLEEAQGFSHYYLLLLVNVFKVDDHHDSSDE